LAGASGRDLAGQQASHRLGRRHMLRKKPQVCIEVDQIDDLTNWRSVIAWDGSEDETR